MPSTASECLSSLRKSTLHNPITGCDWSPEAATASCAPVSVRARWRRATRSRGRNGQSAAALSTHATSGRLAAAQSRPARIPARGPGKSSTVSAMTGKPNAAKRAGSPLALRTRPSHCGCRRAITRSRIVRPPMWRIGLSPPPIRRARPPASSTPGTAGVSLLTVGALALVACGFLFDECKVLVVDDALLAGQCDEALSARASDQRQPDLPRQLDTPCGETGARNQDRNPHPDCLDHHLRGKAARGVQNL